MNSNREETAFEGTRLTFETDGVKHIWEAPNLDVSMDDILNALAGLLIGATWMPQTIYRGMRDYGQEMVDAVCPEPKEELYDDCRTEPV